jgi:nucleotide-binding universal stress UspA family protein
MYNCILVPLDSGGRSERLIRRLQLLIQGRDSAVHLLIVHPPAPRSGRTLRPADKQAGIQTHQHLREVLTWLQAEGITVSAEVRIGDPVESILAVAQDIGADLIAMTIPWRPEAGPRTAANVTEQIIRKAPLPVLVERSCDQFQSPKGA